MITIQSHLVERKWMRAARAWRCYLSLPVDPVLPSSLTALIDRQVNATIGNEEFHEILNPMYVVDVPCKGKGFQLVLETVSEQQASHGAKLTAMVGCDVIVTLTPATVAAQEAAPPPSTDRIGVKELNGLHFAFFKNIMFWRFIEQTYDRCAPIKTDSDCKKMFKEYMGVSSCKEIGQADNAAMIKAFNNWLARNP